MLILFDSVATAAIWVGAHKCIQIPENLPPEAPIVVFYTSDQLEREARVTAVSEAWRQFGRRPVLAVGGARPGRGYFGSEVMALRLAALGVNRRDIISERHSFDTETNIAAARELAPSARAVVLVSDALHLARILMLLRTYWPMAEPVLYPAPMKVELFRVWFRVHYEAVAWLSMFVPEPLREALLKQVRA
ncbi:MAG: YdcF family protein [Hyphomicrobiaceae bacterium]